MSEIRQCHCGRVARFEIRKLDRKTKTGEWIPVCGSCDSQIGIKNLVILGHTRKEAEEINREVKRNV